MPKLNNHFGTNIKLLVLLKSKISDEDNPLKYCRDEDWYSVQMHIDDSPASSIIVSGSPTDLHKFDGNVNSRHCPKRVRQII